MKKLILLAAVSCIGLILLTAQIPDKTKTNQIDTAVVKPVMKYAIKVKDAPEIEMAASKNCCTAKMKKNQGIKNERKNI